MKSPLLYLLILSFFSFSDVFGQYIVPGTWSFRTDGNGNYTNTYYNMVNFSGKENYQEFYLSKTPGPERSEPWNFKMNFRFLQPFDYDADREEKYPLILMLNGLGEAGEKYETSDPRYRNNDNNLKWGAKEHLDAITLAKNDPSDQRAFPGFVIFPQNRTKWWEQDMGNAIEIVELLLRNYNIDPNRVYVHGLSNGGLGTWDILDMRPDLFAAALPMSGNPTSLNNHSYDSTVHIPIWQFTGGTDTQLNAKPSYTENNLNRLRAAGGTPRYYLYPDRGHNTWTAAYKEPDFFSWMLQYSKLTIHPFFGKTQFCEEPFTQTIGISPGFLDYEWLKDGQPFANGPDKNNISISGYGDYQVRFLREVVDKEGNVTQEWTQWSDKLLISKRELTATPSITALGSTVFPTNLDKLEEVTLRAPAGMESYVWYIDGQVIANANAANLTVNRSQTGEYQVLVTVPGGCASEISAPIHIVNNGPTDIIKPTNLTASASSASVIDLFWADNSEDEEIGFEIYRAESANGPYQFIYLTTANAVNFTDTLLKANTTYFYQVRAINTTGSSEYAGPASAKTLDDNEPPGPPQNLSVSKVFPNSIELEWGPASDNVGIKEYMIYQEGKANPVGTSNDTIFEVTGLQGETVYTFYVKAVDINNNLSERSNQVTEITAFCGLYYDLYLNDTWKNISEIQPNQKVADGKVNNFDIGVLAKHTEQTFYYAFDFNGYINIKVPGTYTFWTKSNDGSLLYIDNLTSNPVVSNDGRREDHKAIEKSGTINLSAGLHPIKVRYFEWIGDNDLLEVYYQGPAGSGINKQLIPNEALCTSEETLPAPPKMPSNLTAQTISASEIKLDWVDNTNDETGFEVYRSLDPLGEYTFVTAVNANITSYTDKGLVSNTTYFYKLRTISKDGESSFTDKFSHINYEYYQGSWDNLPDFSRLTPLKTGKVQNFTLVPRNQDNNFAFKFDGYINLPTAGDYTFYTSSDDGSKLYINDVEVVNNDGTHAKEEQAGTIAISSSGLQKITVTFFEKWGGQALEVRYEGPAISKQLIPDAALNTGQVSATTLGDDIPPTVPQNLTVRSKTKESVSLSWDASTDNIGVVGYDIYDEKSKELVASTDDPQESTNSKFNDENLWASAAIPENNVQESTMELQSAQETPVVSYTVKGLDEGATYQFTVLARDAVGNKSAKSAPSEEVTLETIIPQPVEFMNFLGTFENGSVVLKWATATETNNEFFTIERSSDLKNFEAIGAIDGAGNSQSRIDYQYIDHAPLAGTAYYRIKQTDFDGKFDYSKVIGVTSGQNGELKFQVYPNPSDGTTLNAKLTTIDFTSDVKIKIMDIFGKVHYEGNYKAENLSNGARINNLSPLLPGVYIILLQQANYTEKSKIIVNQ